MSEGTNVGSIFLDLVVRDTVEKQIKDIAAKAQAQARQAFSGVEKTITDAVEKAASHAAKSAQNAADQVDKALHKVSDTAATTGKRVETTFDGAFDKTVAMAQARVRELEIQFQRVTDKLDRAKKEDDDNATEKLLEQQVVLYDRLEAARERLAIHIQAAAEKQAAAEIAAAQKAAKAAEAEAAKRQAQAQVHPVTGPPEAAVEPATQAPVKMTFWDRLTAKVEKFRDAAVRALSDAGKSCASLDKATAKSEKRISAMGQAAGHFKSRLKEIVSGALIFNGISAAVQSVTKYFGEAISASSETKEALANLQGAAATAAAPLIEAVTPALVALTNAAAAAFSYLSRLISVFTGKSLASMAEAAKKVQTSANTAKKAMASLAGFDEIQRLDSGAQDSGGSEEAPEPNYDFVGDLPLLDSMLESLKNLDFSAAVAAFGSLTAAAENLGTVILDSLGWAWDNVLVPLTGWFVEDAAPASLNLLAAAVEWLTALLAPAMEGFQALWDSLTPVFEFIGSVAVGAIQVLEGAFCAMTDVFDEKSDKIAGIFSGLGDIISVLIETFGPQVEEMLNTWATAFTFMGEFAANTVGFLIDLLYGLVESVAGTLTGDWDRAWAGITSIFDGMKEFVVKTLEDLCDAFGLNFDEIVTGAKGFINSLFGFLNGLISGAETAVNAILRGINKISFTVPDWVPGIGGQTMGFNLPMQYFARIPYLADGGVITQPTLAMMGEYAGARNNPEIVTPQSILAETFASVMDEYAASNLAGQEAIVEVLREILEAVLGIEIGDEVLGQAVARYNCEMAVVRGGS